MSVGVDSASDMLRPLGGVISSDVTVTGVLASVRDLLPVCGC